MRYLGLDLGTKRCGVAISDKTNLIACPLSLINYNSEDYESLAKEISLIIKENEITDLVIGLPKNMDGSSGFATKRSDRLLECLELGDVSVHFIDERLTTVMASNILRDNGKNAKKQKKMIDTLSACLILEDFMKRAKR